MITKDQFIRGMDAIEAHRDLKAAVDAVLEMAGCEPSTDMGGGKLLDEIVTQLEERCNDPVAGLVASAIGWVVWEGGGDVIEDDGRQFSVRTPDELWTWWETTERGPFGAQTSAVQR